MLLSFFTRGHHSNAGGSIYTLIRDACTVRKEFFYKHYYGPLDVSVFLIHSLMIISLLF